MDKSLGIALLVTLVVVGAIGVGVAVSRSNSAGGLEAAPNPPLPNTPGRTGEFSDTPGGTAAGVGAALGDLLGGVTRIINERNRHEEEGARLTAEERRRESERGNETRGTETRGAGSGRS